jgi:hypothetical protein
MKVTMNNSTVALAVCHDTTCHMLYRDEQPIKYSGVMYVYPCKQCVLRQLFLPKT